MRSVGSIGTTVFIVTLMTAAWAGYLAARPGGITNVCAASDGCRCHDDFPNANGNVTVSIIGPQAVETGSTNSYTLTVTGTPSGTTGGFNLCTSDGSFIAGTDNHVSQGQLTHSNNNNRSWSFEWTAPNSETSVDFTAAGLAGDGSGSGGDSWNWYGDSAGSPFTIEVSMPVPVIPVSWGLLKDRYR